MIAYNEIGFRYSSGWTGSPQSYTKMGWVPKNKSEPIQKARHPARFGRTICQEKGGVDFVFPVCDTPY